MKLPTPIHLNLLAYLLLDDNNDQIEISTQTQSNDKSIEIVKHIVPKNLTMEELRLNVFINEFKYDMEKYGKVTYDKVNKIFRLELICNEKNNFRMTSHKKQEQTNMIWQRMIDDIVDISNKVINHVGLGYMFEVVSKFKDDQLIMLEIRDGIIMYDDRIEY